MKTDTIKKIKITKENYDQFLRIVRTLDCALGNKESCIDFGIDLKEIKTTHSIAMREYIMWAGMVRACKCIIARGEGETLESYYTRDDIRRDVIAENRNFKA